MVESYVVATKADLFSGQISFPMMAFSNYVVSIFDIKYCSTITVLVLVLDKVFIRSLLGPYKGFAQFLEVVATTIRQFHRSLRVKVGSCIY